MGKFNQDNFNKLIIDNDIIGFFENMITLKSGRESNYYVNWRNIAEDAYLIEKLSDFVIDFNQDLGIEPDCFYGVPDGATKLGLVTQYKSNPSGNILTSKYKSVPISWIDNKIDVITLGLDPKETCILGNPKGEISGELGVLAQYNLAKSSYDFSKSKYDLPFARKSPKEHGDPKNKHFVGMPQKTVRLITEHKKDTMDLYQRLKKFNIPVRDIIFIEDIDYTQNPSNVTVLEDVTTTGGSLLSTIEDLVSKNISPKICIGLTNRNELRDDGYSVREAVEQTGHRYENMSKSTDLLPLAYKKSKPSQPVIQALKKQFEKYGAEKLKLSYK